jgi:hypothetical protein
MEHFHDLQDAKRYINAKTPFTLSSLTEGFLKTMRDKPEVPPSMKERLTQALEIKKDKLRGGLAGVSQASGFIQRLMANNKLVNKGQYKNTKKVVKGKDGKPLMSGKDKGIIHFGKIGHATQHGKNENTLHEYGASPFIKKYFYPKDADIRRPPLGNTNPETPLQADARRNHWGRVVQKAPKTEEVPKPIEKEVPKPKEAPKPKEPKKEEPESETDDSRYSYPRIIERISKDIKHGGYKIGIHIPNTVDGLLEVGVRKDGTVWVPDLDFLSTDLLKHYPELKNKTLGLYDFNKEKLFFDKEGVKFLRLLENWGYSNITMRS